MNRIARTAANLIVATGLATAALTFSGTAAHAETPPAPKPGPVLGLGPVDPGTPDGPGDIKTPDPAPQPPKDLGLPKPKPQPPNGPKDLADSPQEPVVDPKPADPAAPTDPADGDSPTNGPVEHHSVPAAPASTFPTADAHELPSDRTVAVQGGGTSTEVPTAIDAENAATSHGHDLAWLLAAGAGAGLGGLVLVAARRRKQAEEA